MKNLVENLKSQIIEELCLDVAPTEIQATDPLFGEGLGLDSIDGLEMVVLVEKYYGIKIESNENMQEIFASVQALAEFIQSNTKAEA